VEIGGEIFKHFLFGCSQRMATQAKRLAIEKGILSTPNPKVGRGLEPDAVESVKKMFTRTRLVE